VESRDQKVEQVCPHFFLRRRKSLSCLVTRSASSFSRRVIAEPAAKAVFRAVGPRDDAARRRGPICGLVGKGDLDRLAETGATAGA